MSSIRGVAPLAVLLFAALLVPAAPPPAAAQAAVETRDLGPASLAFPGLGSALVGDRVYVVSRNVVPAAIAVYDRASGQVVDEIEIPTGVGAWGVTSTEDTVWLGQLGAQGQDNLYRYDIATDTLSAVAAFDANYVWAMDAATDGTIHGVLSPADVFSHDPATGTTTLEGGFADGQLLRSIAVTATQTWIGGELGGDATLATFDRSTRARTDVLPAGLADHDMVYTLASSGDVVAAGTTGPGNADPALAVMAPGAAPEIVTLPGESKIDALALSDDQSVVYAAARPSGALYRYDRATGAVDRIATPVPNSETRQLFVRPGDQPAGADVEIVGTSANSNVWSVTEPGGSVERVDLLERGLDGRPETPQSVTAAEGIAYVGGSFTLQTHDLVAADGTRASTFVPGEPKDMLPIDGVQLALYPGAEVWDYQPGGVPAEVAQLPVDQVRPQAIVRLPTTGELVVSTAAAIGGGLHVVDRATGAVRSTIDPFGTAQHPAGLAVMDGTVYTGGSGGDAGFLAWDPATGQALWELAAPVPGGGTIVGLAATAGRIFGLTSGGWTFVVDPATRSVVHAARSVEVGGVLLAVDGRIFGAGADELIEIDPTTYATTVVLDDLGSMVWGWPKLGADENGDLYVIRGTDLVQVTVP